MKGKPILMGILFSLIIAFAYWKFTQGFDTPKMNYWTQEKMNAWTEKIVSSSNYLSGMDSIEAYEIGSCATKKIIETYTYKETIKLAELSIDSQMTVLSPIINECKLTVDFQDNDKVLRDTIQVSIYSNGNEK